MLRSLVLTCHVPGRVPGIPRGIRNKLSLPAGPINGIDRVFADEQIKSRGVQIDIDGMPLVGNPIRSSRSSLNYEYAPPLTEQHTERVLAEILGLSSMGFGD